MHWDFVSASPRPAEGKENQVFARSSRYFAASTFFQVAVSSPARAGADVKGSASATRRRVPTHEGMCIELAPGSAVEVRGITTRRGLLPPRQVQAHSSRRLQGGDRRGRERVALPLSEWTL